MRTYSTDLRERIVAARERGHSAAEIARLFKLSKRSVERYCKLQATTGSVQPKQRGGYRRSRLEKHDETLRRWIHEQSDLTLAELQKRIALKLKVHLGLTALWHRLEHLGLSYKKNAARRGAEPPRHRPGPPAMAKPATRLAHRQARFPR
jgi:transposase